MKTHKIFFEKLDWFDETSRQAIYEITDGKYVLEVFQARNFDMQNGGIFQKEYLVEEAETIIQSSDDYGSIGISKQGSKQVLMGQLTEDGLHIGEFYFPRDDLYVPKDIKIGSFIEVTAARIDVL